MNGRWSIHLIAAPLFSNHGTNVSVWDVEGDVDYEKLIDKFGCQPITEQLRSRYEFAHDYFISVRDSLPMAPFLCPSLCPAGLRSCGYRCITS